MVGRCVRQSAEWPDSRLDRGGIHSSRNRRCTIALIQDYDNHKNVYQPDVMDSKLVSRNGDDFHISLRLLKKKIITVALDTDHDVHYSSVDDARSEEHTS